MLRSPRRAFLANLRSADEGDRFALALHVHAPDESLEDVGWSKLKDYERLPFVLLYERHGEVKPQVFFGEQGALRALINAERICWLQIAGW